MFAPPPPPIGLGSLGGRCGPPHLSPEGKGGGGVGERGFNDPRRAQTLFSPILLASFPHPTPHHPPSAPASVVLESEQGKEGDPLPLPPQSPLPPPPLGPSKKFFRGKTRFCKRKRFSGHFWYTNPRISDLPLSPPPSTTSLPPPPPPMRPTCPTPPPPPKGCIRRQGTSESAPEAVGQAVGGGCHSGWGRILSVTNAIEPGTCRQ